MRRRALVLFALLAGTIAAVSAPAGLEVPESNYLETVTGFILRGAGA